MTRIFILAVVIAAFLVGCSPKVTSDGETPIIIITLDTLRSDRLPMYGYTGLETPALAAFAKDAVLFERAYAHTPLTLPSHASMFTGQLPFRHGARDNTGYLLAEDRVTLAERLQDQGFETGAVVSSMVLRTSTGIAQGFDFYDDELNTQTSAQVRTFAERRGDASIRIAKEWLRGRSGSTFFWLHLYDPHAPYAPPQPYAQTYDGEIAYTDALMGDFLAFLKEQNLYDDALIMILADHGEGLGDHGEQEHGILIYREAIQVPLMIKFPGQQRAGERIAAPVGLVDVGPTVLDFLDQPPFDADGMSLIGSIPDDRVIYSESLNAKILYGWHELNGTVHKDLHLIEGAESELYDLINDPAERQNLFGERRIPPPMYELLESVVEGVNTTSDISAEDRAMLESLGYTGSFDFGDDVKALSIEQLLAMRDRLAQIQKTLNRKDYEAVETQTTELLREYPGLHEAKSYLAMALIAQDELERAEAMIMEAMVASPRDFSLFEQLANIKLRQEQWPEALARAERAVSIEPEDAGSRLLPAFYERERFQEAAKLADIIIEREADLPYAYFVSGRVALLTGDHAKAAERLQVATEQLDAKTLRGPLISSLAFLAEARTALGQNDQAQAALKRAAELDPDAGPTQALLAENHLAKGDVAAAAAALDTALANTPDNPAILQTAVRVRLAQKQPEAALELADKLLQQDAGFVGPLCFDFMNRAHPDDAGKLAELSLRRVPDQPYGHFVLGRVDHAKRSYPDAMAHYQEAVKHLEKFPDRALFADLAYHMGDASASQGDAKTALPYFQKAVELRPDNPRYQLTLTAFFARLGDKTRALEVAAQWLQTFPSRQNYDQAAQTLGQLGFTQEAERYRQLAQQAGQ